MRPAVVALVLVACAKPPTVPPPSEPPESETPEPAVAPASASPPDAAPASQNECNVDLLDDAVQRWTTELKEDVTRNLLSIQPLADVDDDGKPEHMIFAESLCGTSGNCPRLLYFSKNGCSFGGGFFAEVESEEVLPEVHNGVHDVRIYLKDGCAGLEGRVVVMAWNGQRYAEAKRIQCACPDDKPKRPRDPACP